MIERQPQPSDFDPIDLDGAMIDVMDDIDLVTVTLIMRHIHDRDGRRERKTVIITPGELPGWHALQLAVARDLSNREVVR